MPIANYTLAMVFSNLAEAFTVWCWALFDSLRIILDIVLNGVLF